jgi:hypothetical protein
MECGKNKDSFDQVYKVAQNNKRDVTKTITELSIQKKNKEKAT